MTRRHPVTHRRMRTERSSYGPLVYEMMAEGKLAVGKGEGLVHVTLPTLEQYKDP